MRKDWAIGVWSLSPGDSTPCRPRERNSKDVLIVIGLTHEDYKERNIKAIKDFVNEHSIDYEMAFTPVSLYYYFNKGDSAITIPQTFVFHSNGTMVKQVIGSDVKAVEAAISIALRPAN